MSVFDDIYNSAGEKLYHRAQSKTYSLKEISDYLLECMEEPQNDTKISFEIRDDGEVYISTSNDELAAEIEASFTAIEEREV